MHIDHDYVAAGAQNHEHTHVHEHTHDGVSHTHAHTHSHVHEDEHTHAHAQLHAEGTAHDHSHTPLEELQALMRYMVGHNAAHAQELAELAGRLDESGHHEAYHKVMDAVDCFRKGNDILTGALEKFKNV